MSRNVLHVENVTMQFGGVVAVNNLSMDVNEGEIVALIGPNGAGKTTAFNCITGVYEPTNGKVDYMGETIVENHPHRQNASRLRRPERRHVCAPASCTRRIRSRKRASRVPSRIFACSNRRSVFNNVLIAMHMRRTSNVFTATFRLNMKEERAMRQEAMELLKIVGLDGMADEMATSLPYGQQRRLEIARALATRPKLLLLDEPAAGMNPQETEELGAFIRDIKERFGLTVFMIEHHMSLVMGISDRIYVIDFGKQIAEGTPAEVRDNPAVIAAYLGEDE